MLVNEQILFPSRLRSGGGGAGDTGEVNYGWDYWFNWSVWTAPAALLKQDVSALSKPGGLVHRVIEAGKQ